MRWLLLTSLLLLGALPAKGAIVHGIEFTDVVSIEVSAGTDFVLSTSQDVYVFAPNSLVGDDVGISALDQIFVDGQIVANVITICAGPINCVGTEFDLTSDVLLTILDPIGDFQLEAGGSVVISSALLPEPSVAALVGVTVLALGLRRLR